MAVNPDLAHEAGSEAELFPLPQAGETLILRREQIHFSGDLGPQGTLFGVGAFYLTSTRIVFVCESQANRPDFKSFGITLSDLVNVAFQQPVFGANYLEGIVKPTDSFLVQPAKWSLQFRSGGCGTFLSVFYRLLGDQPRKQELVRAVNSGDVSRVAFVDPSDPSKIFVTQPPKPKEPANNAPRLVPISSGARA
jgi:hypothetical protein